MHFMDYNAFEALAANYVQASRLLSADAQALLLSLLTETTWEDFRHTNGTQLTTGERDIIEETLANAAKEVMVNNPFLGAIVPMATGSLPDNMLLCDGGTYAREDYPELYAVLGAPFIVDADNFSVPNLIDRFIRGTDEFLGDEGGEATHTLTVDEMPSHSHTDTGHTHTEIIAVDTLINGGLEAPAAAATAVPSVTGTGFASLTNTGGGEAHNNIPPYLYLTYAIVAR